MSDDEVHQNEQEERHLEFEDQARVKTCSLLRQFS